MENKNQNPTVSPQPLNGGGAGVVSPNLNQTQGQTPQASTQNAATDSRYYPIENLETPDTATLDQSKNANQQNAQQNSPFTNQFQNQPPKKNQRSRGILAGIVVFGIVASAVAGWLWFRNNQSAQQELSQQIPEQSVELTGESSGLAGLAVDTAASQVLINGNVVTKGALYVSEDGDNFGQITVANLSQNRTITLPDSSGTICLDSNNCGYATNANGINNLVAGTGITIAGSTITNTLTQTLLNNRTGSITLQGTTNQVNVSTNGDVISLALPQSIGTNSSPTFNSVTLKNVGSQNGNVLCDISNNCGYAGGSSAFVQGGNAFGTTATLGTTDNNSLSFITNGATRLSIGEFVGLELAYFNVDQVFAQSLNNSTSALRVTDSSLNQVFAVDTQNKRVHVGNAVALKANVFSVDGTVSEHPCNFGCWGAHISPTVTHSTATGNFGGIYAGYSTDAAAFTLTNGYGIFVAGTIKGAGSTITNNHGILVAAQSAGTNNYGVSIQASGTQTLWVSNNADNTTAAAGIAFGSSRDTNLYRSAANFLRTDDSFYVAGNITSPGSSGSNTQKFGLGADATANGATALGASATASGINSLAVGYSANASNDSATAVGQDANVTGFNSTGVGWSPNVSNDYVTAVGSSVIATGDNSVVVGYAAEGNATGAIAIGSVAVSEYEGSVAIGYYSATTAANQLVIGSDTAPLQDAYLGGGVTSSTPDSITLHATGGEGTDIAGANLNIAGGMGTGSGNGGSINLQIADPGASGTGLNSLATVASFSGTNGAAYFQNTTDSTTGFRVLDADGGTSILNVDTTNERIGIGTDTPSFTLDVVGSASVSDYLEVGANAAGDSTCYGVLGNFDCSKVVAAVDTTTSTNANYGIYNYLISSPTSDTVQTNTASNNVLILSGTEDFNFSTQRAVYGQVLTATSGSVQVIEAMYSQVTQAAGTVGTSYGLRVGSASRLAGTWLSNYGIQVDAQSAASENYGIGISAASTQTLWISNNADNTTASAGIAFGSSRDTNLYRGATSRLTTDDDLQVLGHSAFGADAIPDTPLVNTGSTYSSTITVAEEITDFSNDVQNGITTHLLLNPSTDSGNSTIGHEIRIEVDSANTNDIGSVVGQYNEIQLNGNNHIFDSLYGIYNISGTYGDNVSGFNNYGAIFGATNQSNGGTTNALFGLTATVGTGVGATTDQSIALYVTGSSGGTVTDHTGIYLSDQSGIGSNTSWNLYSEGVNSLNVFEGYVGIGVDASTTYRLDAQSDASSGYVANFFNDGNNQDRYGIRVQAGADDGSGTTYYLDAYDGDGNQVGYLANVAGTFGVTDVSDIRTKTNISDTGTNANDILGQLRVVDYNRLQNPDGPLITGFIAQEVQGVYDQAVTVGADGYLGIMKDAFIPILVKGHQEQQAQIDDIRGQLQSPPSAASSVAQSSDFIELSVSGAATVGSLDVTGSATVASLTVTGSATFNGSIAVAGNLELSGRILGNQSTRGTVVVSAGTTEVEHTFSSPFAATPNVILTPTNNFAPPYRVEANSSKFTVYLESGAPTDITFNYQVQQ